MRQFVLNDHTRPVRMIKYNRDGDIFVTCSDDKEIIVWDNDDCTVIGNFTGPAACKSISLSYNSDYVVGAFTTEGIRVYSLNEGKEVAKVILGARKKVQYVELNVGDSELLVVCHEGDNTEILIYDFNALVEKKNDKYDRRIYLGDTVVNQATWTDCNEEIIACTNSGHLIKFETDGECKEI